MIGSADVTPYDLRFRLLDVPVRVSPWFWLIMAIVGGRSDLIGAAVFVACGFVSILAHEFGHGLSSRALGLEPTGIVLYGMGGYCEYPGWHGNLWHRLLTLLAGPAAGFLLFALVLAGASSVYHVPANDLAALVGVGRGDPVVALMAIGYIQQSPAGLAVYFLLLINFWWGVINLLPVWPLDGGRVTQVVLLGFNPHRAAAWTHLISIVAALGTAVWLYSPGIPWNSLLFGYFAYINYTAYQNLNRFTTWDGG